MATDKRSLPAFNDSDAVFRTWAQGVHAALLACGLVATADTGQADLATILSPTTGQTATFTGFKMYRFDDALQATKPVFIKVEFGTGSTVSKFALAMTVGTMTNGAGGFPNATVSARWNGGGNNVRSTGWTYDQYASGAQDEPGGGRIWLATLFDPTANYSTAIIVERLKDGDGNAHASGAVFCGFLSGHAGNQVRSQILVHGNVPGPVVGDWSMIALIDSTGQTHQPNVGEDLAVAPLMYTLGVWLYGWPLHYRNSDIFYLVPFDVDHLGGFHTFMPMGVNLASLVIPKGAPAANAAVALPWE